MIRSDFDFGFLFEISNLKSQVHNPFRKPIALAVRDGSCSFVVNFLLFFLMPNSRFIVKKFAACATTSHLRRRTETGASLLIHHRLQCLASGFDGESLRRQFATPRLGEAELARQSLARSYINPTRLPYLVEVTLAPRTCTADAGIPARVARIRAIEHIAARRRRIDIQQFITKLHRHEQRARLAAARPIGDEFLMIDSIAHHANEPAVLSLLLLVNAANVPQFRTSFSFNLLLR